MRGLMCGAAFALITMLGFSNAEEHFPNATIRIVVPYAPGVGADLASRVLADKLKDIWGQPVIIDNRSGASGAVGTQAVAHSRPDGYTILVTGESIFSVYMTNKPSYDPLKDLTPVARLIALPFALVARKDFPANNWAEFVAYAHAHPNKVTISTPGYGTPHQILAETLMHDVGLDLYHVPGAAGVMQDVLAGRIDVTFQPASVIAPMLQLGLKVFAAGGMRRTTTIPGAPSFAELGVQPLIHSDSWNGAFVASGTPPEIIQKLSAGFKAALDDPEVASRLVKAGFVVDFADAEAYTKTTREYAGRWEKILHTVREREK